EAEQRRDRRAQAFHPLGHRHCHFLVVRSVGSRLNGDWAGRAGTLANPRNLKAFLDAFKAVSSIWKAHPKRCLVAPKGEGGPGPPVIDALRRFRLIIPTMTAGQASFSHQVIFS